DISPGALSTLRAMTCLNETGEVEVTDVLVRLASGRGLPVDNFDQGNLAAMVDIGTGRISRATEKGHAGTYEWWSHHPQTGAASEGRSALRFLEGIGRARRVHREVVGHLVVVGWDIGITERGAVVREGDWSGSLTLLQRVAGAPVSRSRLGELMDHHFARF